VDVVYPKQVRLTYQAMTPEAAVALVDALKEGGFMKTRACAASTRKIFWWRAWSGLCQPAPAGIAAGVPQI